MTMKSLFLSPMFALVTLVACGDDDGGSTPAAPFESTEPDDQVAGSLTPAEQTAFCQELAAYVESEIPVADFKKLGCYFLALAFTGGDRDMCNQTAQSCISDPENISSSDEYECDQARLTDCTATVAELEACYTDTITVLKSIIGQLSCSTNPEQLSQFDEKPASCQVVEAKCPNLFEDEDVPAEQ